MIANQFREPTGYLDFARFGPPSNAVLAERTRLTEYSAVAGPTTVDDLMRQDLRARAAVARLCRTDTDHVVLLPNTSTGLFQAAFGVTGEVVVSAAEFPANTYPWSRAAGVTPRWVRHVTEIPEALTKDTVAVSLSAVDFRTGFRADLAAMRETVGDRLLVVDGIQGFGVVDEPWEVADVLVVGGQKWLRAGWSTGFMVLSDRALERLAPVLSGWTGAEDPGLFDDSVHEPAPFAAAWSLTNLSPIAAGALNTALELVEQASVKQIEAEISAKIDELGDVIQRAGGQIVSSFEPARRAGILAFTIPGRPAETVGAALTAEGITATIRPEHVRLSPHVSTTADTVDQLSIALKRILPTGRSAGEPRRSVAGVLETLIPTINGLGSALGPGTEVVLHDLSKLPNSIVAIAGDLTYRSVGGPMTDLLLGLVRRGTTQDLTNYETHAPDGRPITSSTVFIRDPDGVAVGCLCVNSESTSASPPAQDVETFPGDVDTLQRHLVERAVADVGVPVSLMKKAHKSQVVKVLDDAGFFLIRDAVDYLAAELKVTRYTIYNYLNETRGPSPTQP
ncbi:aminotransferase class V-fold PLP-dependent enzyme [Kibdelosporangium aridum]|uniref:Selenocysteine lyase/Cysteine desulfurase n=1 Tax=Kibdelosporangium aridum TaxID=2030 RepID=A0A1W2FIL1_KIBAR|nr:aminotransferase class V-fold PLP-dependent enzyme [Kibdelosporangium aridum]SMD21869.1 Selenocysteine lyase/Cysteine desulfurase [Kibdelosporangium aridum]